MVKFVQNRKIGFKSNPPNLTEVMNPLSVGLISSFLEMIGRNEPALRSPNPKVFVNPIFEIKKGFDMPVNKTELVEYLLRGVVVPFHKQICQTCHKIPDFEKWQQEDLNSSKL